MKPQAKTQLVATIEIKDRDGRKIGEKEVATYAGLLAKAHDEGLSRVATRLVQVPSKDNGEVAIVFATVVTKAGIFTGIGDAAPGNVSRRIAGHLIRMAETRAKARALRDAVNIGVVSIEEIGELADDAAELAGPAADAEDSSAQGAGAPSSRGAARSGSDATVAPQVRRPEAPMTDAQRRALFRLAAARGVKAEEVKAWLERHLGIPNVSALTRAQASDAIDQLGANANGANGATAGGPP